MNGIRIIKSEEISEKVKELFIHANHRLPQDAISLIDDACNVESCPLAKKTLLRIRENLDAAARLEVPICQDTGMAIVFAELGQNVHIEGDTLSGAVNEGVRRAYTEGYLRKSVVSDPLFLRKNTNDNTPAILYTEMVPGSTLKLIAAPKGFGSENMSALKMFNPSAVKEDIIAFVAETVKKAGSNPCPPILIGVGIGGSFDYSAVLAKRALTRPVSQRSKNPEYAALEAQILQKVNELGIGSQGFGGDITALGVNIEYAPTHIAGLPVAVNINCHVMRHSECII